MNSVKKFVEDSEPFFDSVGATYAERAQYLEAVSKNRTEDYAKKLMKKYPLSLHKKLLDYYESLSPLEQEEIGSSLEKGIERMVEENPDRFTGDELKTLFNADGKPKQLIADPFEAPIRDLDRGRYMDGAGDLVEQPLEKPVREVRVPTPLEARGMSAEKLRKFIPRQNEEE